MITLLLNKQIVIPKKDTEITIVNDNPLFSKSSTYSLDVIFPLDIPENKLFFGNLNRHDVLQNKTRWNCQINTSDGFVIVGEAVLTEINQDEVIVQVLAGNSVINNNYGELFIDELDLGRIVSVFSQFKDDLGQVDDQYLIRKKDVVFQYELWHTYKYYKNNYPNNLTDHFYNNQPAGSRFSDIFAGEYDHILDEDRSYHSREFAGVLFVPIYNSTTQEFYNKIEFVHDSDDNKIKFGILTSTEDRDFAMAPQMKLTEAIKRIFAEIGYTVNFQTQQWELFENAFIANSTPTKFLAKTLPHWTINEFMSEIEKLFRFVFVVHNDNNVVDVIHNSDLVNKTPSNKLIEVVDDFTINVADEDTSKDPATGNCGYNFPENEDTVWHKINPDFKRYCKIIDCPTYNELQSNQQTYNDRHNYIYYFNTNLWYKIELNGPLKIVDTFRNKINDTHTDELSVEYKIIPAHSTIETFRENNNLPTPPDPDPFDDHNIVRPTLKSFQWPASEGKITFENFEWKADPNLQYKDPNIQFSLRDAINGEETIADEQTTDTLALFFPELETHIGFFVDNYVVNYETDSYEFDQSQSFTLPIAYSDYHLFYEAYGEYPSNNFSLSLFKRPNEFGTIAACINHSPFIDTSIEYAKTIFCKTPIQAGDILIIHNKKFIAKSITYKITDEGLSPLQEGIFYMLED